VVLLTGNISYFGNVEFYVDDDKAYVDVYAGEFVQVATAVNARRFTEETGALPDTCLVDAPIVNASISVARLKMMAPSRCLLKYASRL